MLWRLDRKNMIVMRLIGGSQYNKKNHNFFTMIINILYARAIFTQSEMIERIEYDIESRVR